MIRQDKKLVWIAFPGMSMAETINAYWYYCEQKSRQPEKIVLICPEMRKADMNGYISGFNAVSETFMEKGNIKIQTLVFKDDDTKDFLNQMITLMERMKKEKLQIIFDISATMPGFIPVVLYNLAIRYNPLVDKMYYALYSRPEYRQNFYPLIPCTAFNSFNIFKELSDGE